MSLRDLAVVEQHSCLPQALPLLAQADSLPPGREQQMGPALRSACWRPARESLPRSWLEALQQQLQSVEMVC